MKLAVKLWVWPSWVKVAVPNPSAKPSTQAPVQLTVSPGTASALNREQVPSLSHCPELASEFAEESVAEAFNKPQFSNAAASMAFAIPDMFFLCAQGPAPCCALEKY